MIVKPEFSDHNKEMLEDLRDGTGSGSISNSIITYCDYGTKTPIYAAQKINDLLRNENLTMEMKDLGMLKEFFQVKGVNYYTVKEALLNLVIENKVIEPKGRINVY